MHIATKYNPKVAENRWYNFWLEKKYFHSEPRPEMEPYTIVIPPPNITGSLHMGHALNNILQDILIRLKRMQGYNALWLPGTDHGGIATQNVLEKELLSQGLTREKLGREKFLKRMWEWRSEVGDTILEQLKRLGCSCDWERTRFTMDSVCERAVLEAFVYLYRKGLIYRGEYIVNWCPRCQTALSDIEVEHEEVRGKLWYIKYPLKSSKRGVSFVMVATTRPETMLGDTAVAVNPKDKRYKGLIGREVILPIMDRPIPIVADGFVDSTFGSGAVKVTPAHDPDDFKIAQRYNLPSVKVINEQGRMTEASGKYQGKDRFECRKELVEELREKKYLEKIEDYNYSIGHCYRCQTILEPLVSEQWYLKTGEMAKKAIAASRKKRVRLIPEGWSKPYLNWLEELHDWCISRQIWWGHRIPVWYCQKGCSPVAAVEKPERCPQCGNSKLIQDPDVLDTWFSSALWPFSTFGWPKKEGKVHGKSKNEKVIDDLDYYYPTSVLVTGYEILYLWVARMVMMGLTLMGDIPFSDVYIHGIVRDAKGRKMSKSIGNVIDPLGTMEKYGTDALRFAMACGGVMGRDVQLSEDNFRAGRNFANKIWNASRLVLMNLEGFKLSAGTPTQNTSIKERLTLPDRWILDQYNRAIEEVTIAFEEYDISRAARLLYEFIWSKFCDWYLELAKMRLYGQEPSEREAAQVVLIYVLEGTLKLLHPIMPFITEEIWHLLNSIFPAGREESIMVSSWPLPGSEERDEDAVEKMGLVIDVISQVRNVRSVMRIPHDEMIEVFVKPSNRKQKTLLDEHIHYIESLAKAKEVIADKGIKKPEDCATAVVGDVEIYVPLKGMIDIQREVDRLSKEIEKIEIELERVNKKLKNKEFLKKAPTPIVEKVKRQKEEYKITRDKLLRNLKLIKE
ncbi:valine--tRNA ligase [bacterium]|nr:valine--tRNA ligase [bacterium]NIN91868.1 valine--tRNA ligase [bacterium]NIO18142.1 valine--tRNA ligase [bacterium]NIO73114.1 valine--tRNA ligase [bacterium]